MVKSRFRKFLNVKIFVPPLVFQPRKETEFWTKKVIQDLKKERIKKLFCLDLFCGTGCIGISLAKNIKNLFCDFGDIEKKALLATKINLDLNKIERNQARIVETNVFSNIKRKYHLVVANPPYIAEDRTFEVQKEVLKKESFLALFGGKDGLFWIKKFLKEMKNFLTKNGKVYFEFDPYQKIKIERILKKYFKKFKFFKDQFKKWRFCKIVNL